MKKIISTALALGMVINPLNIFSDDTQKTSTTNVTTGVVRERPTISGAVDQTIREGDGIDLLFGVTAYDEQDGNLTTSIKVSPSYIDTSIPGKHIVTYSVTDKDGNVNQISVQIQVLSRSDIATVTIPDKNLRARINYYLNQGANDSITMDQMAKLESIDLSNRKITSLEGLQYCTNLKMLNISNNEIKDIGYLSHIERLENLNASNNQISDVMPLSSLIYLKNLDLSENQISNIYPLSTFQGEKIRLHNQKITLSEVSDNSENKVTIKNFIKDENERIIPAFDVDEYRTLDDTIVFNNIFEDTTKTFKFTKGVTLGNVVTIFKGEVTVPIKNAYVDEIETGFSDVPNNYWSRYVIYDFVSKGYVGGYSDNTFRPDYKITRAEFIKIFNRYFGLTNGSGVVFKDTQNHWAKDEIDIAVTNGVVNGMKEDEFWPDDFITREQAAVIISNYQKLSDTNYDKISIYKDSNEVSSWAKSSLEAVVEKGYINGYTDRTIRPKNHLTRAEVVSILSRIPNNSSF